jgi:hypothetical protein
MRKISDGNQDIPAGRGQNHGKNDETYGNGPDSFTDRDP